MKVQRKRPELLLAAAALLIAAATLLGVGAKNALEPSKITTQPINAAQQIGNADAQDASAYASGSEAANNTHAAYWSDSAGIQAEAPLQGVVPQQPAQSHKVSFPVNLNTATLEQLDALPGIGPAKAKDILAWRATHGTFANANQLLQIKGIGQKTLDKLLPLITW